MCMKNKLMIFITVLVALLLPVFTWADSVVFDEIPVSAGTIDPDALTVDLSGIPASDTSKYVKIANDIAASGDTEPQMPNFRIILERHYADDPPDVWHEVGATPSLLPVPDTNELLTGYIMFYLTIEDDGVFEKIYTIRIRLQNGGWVQGEPAGAQERILIGIQNNNAAEDRTYFAALGDTAEEAEVPFLKVVSEPVDFGGVQVGIHLPDDMPEPQTATIANVGTGNLNIDGVDNPIDDNFSLHGSLIITNPMQPFQELDIQTMFTPSSSTSLGPHSTTMDVDYYPEDDPTDDSTLQITLQGTAMRLELAMLFDVSASMGWRPEDTGYTDPPPPYDDTRICEAKLAGRQIQILLQGLEGDTTRVGLFTFPEQGVTGCVASAGTITGLGALSTVDSLLDSAWSESGVGSLQATYGGLTPMAEGLMEAHGTEPGNFGDGSDDKWTPSQFVRRALLMLSDGAHYACTDSAPPLSTPEDWVTYLDGISDEAKKIRIFTIAYGNPDVGGDVDHEILSELAEAAEGGMYDADSLGTAQINKKFREALIRWVDWDEIADPSGTITKGQTKTHKVCIDESVSRIAFVVDWKKVAESAINFVLIGPSGIVSPSSPEVTFEAGKNSAIYIVRGETAKGIKGRSDLWTLKLTGGAGLNSGESVNYNYSVIAKSKVKMSSQIGTQPFFTFDKRRFELKISGLKQKRAKSTRITLKYDIPKESYGTWLSSMRSVNPSWLIRPTSQLDVMKSPSAKRSKLASGSTVKRQPKLKKDIKKLTAPIMILDEPATIVQRKAYALKHFAKRPFQNRRSKGEIQLNDEGKRGDRIAGDGIYSAYLPNLKYDGLARFGVFLSVVSGDCLNRELRIDKLIRVAMDRAVLAKNIRFQDVKTSPFFSTDLTKLLKQPIPRGFVRKSVIVTPKDKGGNYWGPGHARQIKFAVKNAEPLGPVVDNLDGSYTQVIQYREKTTPSVKVTVKGITTDEIRMGRKMRLLR